MSFWAGRGKQAGRLDATRHDFREHGNPAATPKGLSMPARLRVPQARLAQQH